MGVCVRGMVRERERGVVRKQRKYEISKDTAKLSKMLLSCTRVAIGSASIGFPWATYQCFESYQD